MRLRLPPTTNISDRVGLIGRGHRTRTLPHHSKTIILAAENTLMNMLRGEEPFILRGTTAVSPAAVFGCSTSSGGKEELVCILKQISLPLT